MREPLLTSTKIRLRAIEPEDAVLMFYHENDTTQWDSSTTIQPLSRSSIRQFISSSTGDIYTDGQLRLVIEVINNTNKTTHHEQTDDSICDAALYRPIGFIDLTDFSARHLRAEVGIAILQQYQNKGYGQQALSLLEQYAHDILFIHQLYAYVSANNATGKHLFIKSGYQHSGTLKDWLRTSDAHTSVELFQKILV